MSAFDTLLFCFEFCRGYAHMLTAGLTAQERYDENEAWRRTVSNGRPIQAANTLSTVHPVRII